MPRPTPTACSARSWRENPGGAVAETDLSLAFRDLNPQAPTHVLVIPKRHRPTSPSWPRSTATSAVDVLMLARRVAREEGLTPATGWSPTTVPPRSRPCSTPTCTFWAAVQLTWPPG